MNGDGDPDAVKYPLEMSVLKVVPNQWSIAQPTSLGKQGFDLRVELVDTSGRNWKLHIEFYFQHQSGTAKVEPENSRIRMYLSGEFYAPAKELLESADSKVVVTDNQGKIAIELKGKYS